MKKKIFTFLFFLFLSSCGYEATYSLKNRSIYAFSISELVLTGDRQINLKIKQLLNPYTNTKIEEEKKFILNISSSSEKIITTKDAAGDAVKFKNEITVRVQVLLDGKNATNLVIIEDFIYDNNSDTFELRTYENQIKNNLAEAAVNKILFKLVNNL
ncbi:hypothetical protein N8007_02105 [Pelagibacteraceae bacterium]|nr:hypothetical protein [Pelagibacteraceae bacterium]